MNKADTIKKYLELKTFHEARSYDELMRYKTGLPKYLYDKETQSITGLNLANISLTDEQWQHIVGINGLANTLEYLNLSYNQLTRFEFPEGGGLRRLKGLRLIEN